MATSRYDETGDEINARRAPAHGGAANPPEPYGVEQMVDDIFGNSGTQNDTLADDGMEEMVDEILGNSGTQNDTIANELLMIEKQEHAATRQGLEQKISEAKHLSENLATLEGALEQKTIEIEHLSESLATLEGALDQKTIEAQQLKLVSQGEGSPDGVQLLVDNLQLSEEIQKTGRLAKEHQRQLEEMKETMEEANAKHTQEKERLTKEHQRQLEETEEAMEVAKAEQTQEEEERLTKECQRWLVNMDEVMEAYKAEQTQETEGLAKELEEMKEAMEAYKAEQTQDKERLTKEHQRQLEEVMEAANAEQTQETERLATELEETKETMEAYKAQATDAQLELKRYKSQEPSQLEAWRFVLAVVLAGIVLLQPGVNWE